MTKISNNLYFHHLNPKFKSKTMLIFKLEIDEKDILFLITKNKNKLRGKL